MALTGRSAPFYRLLAPSLVAGISLFCLQIVTLRDIMRVTNVGFDYFMKPFVTNKRKMFPLKHMSDKESREHCQIVYVLGVEGVSHHGFEHIINSLARIQRDPVSDQPYELTTDYKDVKQSVQFALYGERHYNWATQTINTNYLGFNFTQRTNDTNYTAYEEDPPPIDDPVLIRNFFDMICPRDGRKHITIDWHSFPSGLSNQTRPVRQKREAWWEHRSPRIIADSESAMRHPLNLTAFYEAYSPHAEIKFLVLHRPYLETIASHVDWFNSTIGHSQVTRGFLRILRRFLDSHTVDTITGKKLWHLVCIQDIFSKTYLNEVMRDQVRAEIIKELASFLDWPVNTCPNCFDLWKDSSKDAEAILGDDLDEIKKHAKSLRGMWPPLADGEECSI